VGDLTETPGVQFDEGAILSWYGDQAAPALSFDPIPFDPEPHELDHANNTEGA
jgi:hypothetical protein